MQPKPIWESKTFWINVLIVVVGALTIVSQQIELTPEIAQWVMVAVGVLNLILRLLTGQPIQGSPAAKRQ